MINKKRQKFAYGTCHDGNFEFLVKVDYKKRIVTFNYKKRTGGFEYTFNTITIFKNSLWARELIEKFKIE